MARVEAEAAERQHATFDELIEQALRPKTRRQYRAKWVIFNKYVRRDRGLSQHEDDPVLSTITDDEMKRFFEHIQIKRVGGPFGDPLEPAKYNSWNHVNGYKSALVYHFKIAGQELSKERMGFMRDYMQAYKTKCADLKQAGDMAVKEGKSAASFQVYRLLAKRALEQTKDIPQAIFAWSFEVLCWNLIARSNSVGGILFQHIGWEEVRSLLPCLLC